VFMAVSWIADYWASHASSRPMQYVGLGLYVVAESLIFVPLLVIVELTTRSILSRGGHEPHIIRDAAFTTLGVFGALTASVLVSKKDFSFLRSGLAMMSGAALMLIVLSLTFGFNLGIVFSIGMVVLAAGYILYQTSQVLAHYDPQQHVAAALALFSSIALMFWYIIRIFLRMRE
jgi:FtsH-binding integral membrane protein